MVRVPQLTSTRADGTETRRVEAFSDGVFAISMTLLGFQLKVPVLGNTSLRVSLAGHESCRIVSTPSTAHGGAR